MYGAIVLPGIVCASLLFWECHRQFSETHEPNLKLIEQIMAVFASIVIIGLMGYFWLLGWFAKNAVDKMYEDFEWYKKRMERMNRNRKSSVANDVSKLDDSKMGMVRDDD